MQKRLSNLLGKCDNKNCSCNPTTPFIEILDEKNVYLFDEDIPGSEVPFRLVSESDYYQLGIQNDTKVPYTLVKVDNCLISSKSNRKCDAFLYNNSSFFFIEIKDVKKKIRSIARSEAIDQLEKTIKLFEGFDFGDKMVSAIIGFKTQQPYIISASKNTKRAIFKELYNIFLMEGSQIVLQ